MTYDNSHCIERASAAMTAYRSIHDERDDAQVRDLIADLAHWCAANGFDFETEARVAADFVREETTS